MTWNEKLKSLLEENKLSPEELSSLTNVSTEVITSWLSPMESSNYSWLSRRDYLTIESFVEINNLTNEEDKERFLSDRIASTEYHLGNGMKYLEAFLVANADADDDEKTTDMLKNLERAYDDIRAAKRFINKFSSSKYFLLKEFETPYEDKYDGHSDN